VNRRAPLFAGIAAVVVVLVALAALLLPKVSAVHKRQQDLDQARTQEQTLHAQLGQLQQDKQEAKAVQKQLQKLETKIPPTADLPSLIRLLQGAANAAAVDYMSTSPGAPTPPAAGGVSTIPLQITVGGSFFSVQEFLFRLEQLPRAVKVTQVAITPSGGGAVPAGATAPDELSLSITAQVFTTDTSAGPGSTPGPTAETPSGVVPAPTTSPGASPIPSATPTTSAGA
jgi:type IV pilus assembly protein PilO